MKSALRKPILLLGLLLACIGTARANSHTEGGKSVLVLDCYYQDTSPTSITQTDINNLFKIGQSGGLDELLRNDSFGRSWYTSVEWVKVQLPANKSYYSGAYSTARLHALTASGKNASNYDRTMTIASGTISSTGLAFVGGTMSFYNSLPSLSVAHHELGHNLGLYHANRYRSYPEPRGNSGSFVEYGDGDDVMGGGNNGRYIFNAYYKRRLDYLKEANGELVEAANGQTYRIYDHSYPDLSPTGTTLRGVRIPIEGTALNSNRQLWLSHTYHKGSDLQREGLQIHSSVMLGGTASYRLDMSPTNLLSSDSTGMLADIRDSQLKVGQTYTDVQLIGGSVESDTTHPGRISVTVLDKGMSSGVSWVDAVVHIESSGANTAAPAAAAISGAGSANTGQSIGLTASATDGDGDTLAFFWDFGDGTHSAVNSGIQNKSWSTPGYYLVTVTISDRRGGVATAQHWVNVGSQTERAPDTDATTGGLAYRYYEGIFTQIPDFSQLLPKASGTMSTVGIPPVARNDDFAVEITGYLDVPAPDIHQFALNSEDSSRLYIGNTLVISNTGERNSPIEKTGNISLAAGKHAFTVQLSHHSGQETLALKWATLGQPLTAVGAGNLFQHDWQGNLPPNVAITNPADGGSIDFGTTPNLSASASDGDGIAKVQFFLNGSFLGEDSSAPYELPWVASYAGTFTLTALAYDTTGRSGQTQSTFSVTTPARNQIGVNFIGSSTYSGNPNWPLIAGESAGAVYLNSRWNNLTGSTPTINVSLNDQTGSSSAVRISQWSGYKATGGPQFPTPEFFSQANTATPNGKLFKGLNWRRYDQDSGWAPYLTFDRIPYPQYEVYVYFDYEETGASTSSGGTGRPADTTVQKFSITSLDANAASPAAIYGKSSLSLNDGVGDWPNYDSWTNFKEATGTSYTDTNANLLGNYVVFRNLTANSFKLLVDANGGDRYLNAVQIVESPATIARLHLTTAGGAAAVTEGGATATYEAVLTVAPTSPVAVSLEPPADLTLDKDLLYFTPENWNIPQIATISAVNDTEIEGTESVNITHTLSGSGNYAGVAYAILPVTITDNDVVNVTVTACDAPKEAGPTTGKFQIVRQGSGDITGSLLVNFTLSGSAATGGSDYSVSGTGVTYNTGNATGAVTIPAGQAQAFVNITAVDDGDNEGPESVALNINSVGPGAQIGSPASASFNIADNDRKEYYAQQFNTNATYPLIESAFDLGYKTITFTPDGSSSYYAATIAPATVFPESTAGHTSVSLGDDSFVSVTTPVNFYGTTYNTLFINSNGHVTFDSSNTATAGNLTQEGSSGFHFRHIRVAPYWEDLNPSVGGTITWRRISTSGQERTIITFSNVPHYSPTAAKANFQIVMWDSGVMTITWLKVDADVPMVGLSNLQQTTRPGDFVETNLSELPPTSVGNSAPVFATTPSTAGTSGTAYAYTIATTDADADSLTLTAPTKPAWLSLSSTGNGTATLTGTPPAAGSYPVILQVSDGVAAAVQQSFTLVVNNTVLPRPPSIIENPASQSVAFNGSVNFRVVATGTPTLSYQWYSGDLELTDNGTYVGVTTSQLSVNSVQAGNAGDYYCVVTNAHGEATSGTATLNVGEPIAPSFTTHPVDQTVAAGTAAVFSVAVTGTIPLTYRWQKGGIDLSDGGSYSGVTTATLTISNAQLTNEGGYRVLVSNPSATDVASDTATLEVNSAPQLAVDSPVGAAANLANLNDRLVLETTVSDDGKPSDPGAVTIAWSRISGPGAASFEDPSAEDTTVILDQAGSYVLRVSANDGLATITRDVTVTVDAVPSGSRRYLINFSEPASATGGYASDGVRTWQTFDLNTGSGSGTGSESNPKAVNAVPIVDESGSASQGLTFSASGGSNGTVAWHRNATAAQLSGDPFDWFDGAVQAQRDCFAVQNGSAPWNFAINGFSSSDEVKIEFVFARFNTGDRAMTVTYQTTGDVLNDAQVDEDGGPQYPILGGVTPVTGASGYGVSIVPSGTGWGCLPNAIAVTVFADASLAPMVSSGPDANAEAGVVTSLAGSATDDGLPNPPAALSFQWTQLGGPGTAVFGDAESPTSTVTFPVSGSYTLRLTASDGAVRTADDVVYTVTGGGLIPVEQWRQTHFGQTANTGNAANDFDFDNDGLINLLERATGTIPTDGASSARPTVSKVDVSGTLYPAITYRQLGGGAGLTGVDYTVDGMTYTVEHDTDLAGVWSSGGVTVASIQTDTPSAGIDTVTVRLNSPVSGAVKRFLRLRVIANPE